MRNAIFCHVVLSLSLFVVTPIATAQETLHYRQNGRWEQIDRSAIRDNDSRQYYTRTKDGTYTAFHKTAGTKYAILVGINEYPKVTSQTGGYRLTDLDFCVADMEGLRDSLLKCQFLSSERNLRLLTTNSTEDKLPTKANILKALDEIVSQSGPEDMIFCAFAGHGLNLAMRENDKNADFLCCSDAKVVSAFDYDNLILRAELEQKLDSSPAKVKILMIDACRNVLDQGTTRSLEKTSDNLTQHTTKTIRGFGEEQEREKQVQGFVRLASCSVGQVSHEGIGDVKNGVFTYYLIRGLQGEADKKANSGNGNGKITLDELFSYASVRTEGYVKNEFSSSQTPTQSLMELTVLPSSLVLGTCAPEVEPKPIPQQSPENPVANQTNRISPPTTTRPSNGGRGNGGGGSLSRSGGGR